MISRCVERIEAVIFVFHFRTVGNNKPDFAKRADVILGYMGQRMEVAQSPPTPGESNVRCRCRSGGSKFQFSASVRERGFNLIFGGIDELPSGRFFLFT